MIADSSDPSGRDATRVRTRVTSVTQFVDRSTGNGRQAVSPPDLSEGGSLLDSLLGSAKDTPTSEAFV